MMILMDSNILTRAAQPGHPLHQGALDAVGVLKTRGDEPCIVSQNLYEFWAVATRPLSVNGLAMTIPEAQAELARIKSFFRFFADTPAVYLAWETLVARHAVAGKNSHDARLVAAMNVHGITHLLTFNGDDFKRFTSITIVAPSEVK